MSILIFSMNKGCAGPSTKRCCKYYILEKPNLFSKGPVEVEGVSGWLCRNFGELEIMNNCCKIVSCIEDLILGIMSGWRINWIERLGLPDPL